MIVHGQAADSRGLQWSRERRLMTKHIPSKPVVSQDHVRTLQGFGGDAYGGYRCPFLEISKNTYVLYRLKKDITI